MAFYVAQDKCKEFLSDHWKSIGAVGLSAGIAVLCKKKAEKKRKQRRRKVVAKSDKVDSWTIPKKQNCNNFSGKVPFITAEKGLVEKQKELLIAEEKKLCEKPREFIVNEEKKSKELIAREEEKLKSCIEKKTCNDCDNFEFRKQKCIEIRASDIGKRGYVITQPGTYCLESNITFTPASNGIAAITIAANLQNVNIKFDDHVLLMDPASTAADNIGVLIQPGCQTISISDGTIQGFSAFQIKALNNLNGLSIANMTLIGIPQSAGGSRLLQPDPLPNYPTGIVNSFAYTSGLAIIGTSTLLPNNNITIENVIVRNFFLNIPSIPDLTLWAVIIANSNGVEISDLTAAQNLSTTPLILSPHAVAGLYVVQCSNVTMRKANIRENHAYTPDFNGKVTGDGWGVAFLQCEAVDIYDSVSENNGGTRRCSGIVMSSCNDLVIERCSAENNSVPNPGAPGVASNYGFELVAGTSGTPLARNVIIRDCHVNNQSTCFVANGYSNVLYEDCMATAGHLVNTTPASGAFGFAATRGSNIDFHNCIATGFQDTTGTAGTGFYLAASAPVTLSNTNVRNCKSINNDIGILIDSPMNSAVIDSNETAFNVVAGIKDSNGISPSVSSNLILRNLSYRNGTNYIGVPPNNIVTGTPAILPLPPAPGLLNVSIS